ncbi:Retrovirus-related Pol polyprotein from transposon TNT 1-94 [Linum perenne]
MYSRFNGIVSKLKVLGRTYGNAELVRKILRSLPVEWMPKKTAIEESKDLNTLKLEDLVGSLLSHDHLLNVNKVDEDSKRKKNIAFRASHKKECSDSETDDDIVEELALMSNKFKQFLKFKRNQKRQNASGWDRNKNASRGKSFSKTNRDEQKESDEKEPVTCYKCGRTGHIRAECPNKRHGHAMAVTWSDTESDSEDDRKSGLALMAHIDNAGHSDFEVHSTEQVGARTNEWFLDSGCSHHMTGNSKLFSELTYKNGGSVTFGDNSKGKVVGHGTIGTHPNPTFRNVLLVSGLKHNLLSISQLCGLSNRVVFEAKSCRIERLSDNELLFEGSRKGNVYMIDLSHSEGFHETCFAAMAKSAEMLWHRRLGHISLSRMSKLSNLELVKGLPKLKDSKDFFCEACVLGKQTRSSFKSKLHQSTDRVLALVHMDLVGPANIKSFGGKYYIFVLVDDYSRYIWVYFLAHKDEALEKFKSFVDLRNNEQDCKLSSIRSDHGGEFDSDAFEDFCESRGIDHTFSAPRTPQQNGVVERKNRALLELARAMLHAPVRILSWSSEKVLCQHSSSPVYPWSLHHAGLW